MYLIIVGAGDIGTPLIDIATRAGNEVVVVENDPDRADHVASEYDCLVLEANATVKSTLADAGADRADAIVTTTDKDATNIMICLLAGELDIPEVISVVHDPEHMTLYERIGVNTMENPQQLIAEHLYRAVARPAIGDFLRIGETAEVFEIEVTGEAPIADKTIAEAAAADILPEDVLIVAIDREDSEPVTPHGNIRFVPGDVLTVYSGFGATPELTDVFGHYEDD